MGHKRGHGKSMKNALHVQRYGKRYVVPLGETTLNSEKIKSVALAIVELRESEDISKSVENSVK